MKINIEYWVEGKPYAARLREHSVPRIGESVRLKSGIFKVTDIVWHENDTATSKIPRVAIELNKLEKA